MKKTSKQPAPAGIRAKPVRQLRDMVKDCGIVAVVVVNELARRYAKTVKQLQQAHQDAQDRAHIDLVNFVDEVCCVLNESDEDWNLEDIVQLIREKSRVDEPRRPVIPIEDVRRLP